MCGDTIFASSEKGAVRGRKKRWHDGRSATIWCWLAGIAAVGGLGFEFRGQRHILSDLGQRVSVWAGAHPVKKPPLLTSQEAVAIEPPASVCSSFLRVPGISRRRRVS